ncbi:hypothetical protein A2690_01615 [Candidatus Roizmanbacteria bacterium RIFCSPHIGHO2_01_FULL_39_12b]|uniref:TNase-like domain-containing protein n=1 Tax=Candidatus Roizmanbacteria bacterium RIFCSPHIGHO2_01_FULL_39_12b TaxID=1802030 RepID=A0A1F7GB60_9BACT|nr:MAG: hypothetical protein A2690_01615 [Candidatus Roizmanbacteria bacterium RIFCSPHIGHO2_01_FULL_39_12b]OGK46120.1 MAG: hypothetical protein A3B46_02860 [Candidatus Roizmanbacteria bacterium RIFCSPLOWO2_01_FULL_39_19]
MTNKFLLLAFAFLVAFYISSNQKFAPSKQTKPYLTSIPTPTHKPGEIFVARVIDGDTIILSNGQRVRYIGINTPELSDDRKKVECFAVDALMANRSLIEWKVVRMEKDVSEVDKYGRLLRYVYIANPSYVASKSGEMKEIFVNDYLVKYGFAQAATYPPDVKYHKIFLASQKEAKSKELGLWKNCKKK